MQTEYLEMSNIKLYPPSRCTMINQNQCFICQKIKPTTVFTQFNIIDYHMFGWMNCDKCSECVKYSKEHYKQAVINSGICAFGFQKNDIVKIKRSSGKIMEASIKSIETFYNHHNNNFFFMFLFVIIMNYTKKVLIIVIFLN